GERTGRGRGGGEHAVRRDRGETRREVPGGAEGYGRGSARREREAIGLPARCTLRRWRSADHRRRRIDYRDRVRLHRRPRRRAAVGRRDDDTVAADGTGGGGAAAQVIGGRPTRGGGEPARPAPAP